MAVKLNKHDLEFILKQIKVAEAHAAGTPLTDLISQPHLPYGLRTVDGTYNNILPGRELWGAADQTMPRMFDPHWRNDQDGDQMSFGPVEMGAPPPVTNTNYDSSESVADADPRIISNLIVDMTVNNPAAVEAWFANELARAAWEEAHPGMTPVRPNQPITDAATQLHITNEDLALIPNIAPDEGLSAPFNGWMTFFGQFFDHGLDLISKGGAGTIYVPLQPDDPLYVEGSHTNFMVLTRATQFDGPGPDGVLGTPDDTHREAINVTTPFVDQNQTYTSHPSHQVFLREYEMVFSPEHGHSVPLATGRLLDGQNGGLPTWADVKQQAREKLGINLTDSDVFNIPLIRTDPYGEFIRDANGFPQVIIGLGPDGLPNTEDDLVASGTAEQPLNLLNLLQPPTPGAVHPIRTSHSFLDDIAHNAVPVLNTQGLLVTDNAPVGEVDPAGNAVQFDPLTGANTEYDNELLDRHFITGDGRGNENIGLTAVHHVFHSEHNRQVAANKLEILKTKDLDFINEWLRVDLTQEQVDAIPAGGAALAAYADTLAWDGERLFQTARFATEMQYQHLVFEEFGRKIQPLIDPFVFNTITDIDPAIFAEFAHVVYRFGHSMLTDDIARLFLNEEGQPVRYDADGNPVPVTDLEDWNTDIGLIEAFLNPLEYDQNGTISHEQAAGAIFRGMTKVHGNEIDEFVVNALRNNLLGLPLDLAAINIARGRDTGMPTLNEARAQLYAASNSSFLKPYENWTDFAANLKTPASVINFIAAYGTHPTILAAGNSVADRRAAAMELVLGTDQNGDGNVPGDRLEFLNGTGAWAGLSTGLNDIDLWIGGLAEKKMPFGGMLGSTFNAVFEAQLEMLQDLDRFYYLTRTQGLNLLNELENNAFSKLIMANTDMTDPGPDGVRGTEDDIIRYAVGVDSFALHDYVLEVDPSKQIGPDPTHNDETLNGLGLTKVQRDNPATPEVETNYLRFIGGEHTAINGTDDDDTIIADFGDDAIWGGGGNDRIEGGAGVDLIIGGAGDDIITDSGDTGDFIKGEDGDDVIANSNGLDVVMGGDGQDVILVGVDGTEVFAGEGNDFILGGADVDFLMGNEGDDWIEGGDGFDTLAGDNSELFFNSTIIGHDVLFAGENENDFDAESGDDIMVQGESVMRNEGMLGFDWAIHKGNRVAADSDMRIPIFTNVADDILRDRFDQTEALSGWIHNDILRGDDRGSTEEIEAELSMVGHELTWAGVERIDGLAELLGLVRPEGASDDDVAFTGGNILIGGDGHDVIEGRGGNDFIHGDAWLNVRISIRALDENGVVTGTEILTVDSLKQAITVNGVTKPLSEFLLQGVIKPKQLQIVREIKYAEDATDDVDTAVFAGNRDWYEITHLDGDIVQVARREQEEIDPQIDEGVDTLIGIERIQFADQIYTIRETGNVDPTGRLKLGPLPAEEGKPLVVDASEIRDLNNPDGLVTNITYRWQIERNDGTGDYINIPGAFGTTFTPDDEHTGLRIRVIGTYTDAGGVTETVTSAPTDVVIGVNDPPSGALLISDMSPTEGQELTVTAALIDPDGMSDAFEEALLSYQWRYADTAIGPWTNVPAEEGGNSRTFTPGPAHVGKYLQVVFTYTDDLTNEHVVESAVTAIVGNRVVSNAAVIDGASGDAEGGLNGGDNFVQGGDAANTITGQGGNDVLHGGGGDDTLNGGAGQDTLSGGAGADTINGGAGDDLILYGSEDGADIIDGGDAHDTLRVIESAVGSDDTVTVSLSGGVITNVNDASVQSIESAQMDLGNGADTLAYQGATPVSVNLLAGTATGFSFIRGVEHVTGGEGNDTLLGNSLANVLDGAGGDDTVRGGFGNDTVRGGAGNDLLYGEQGDDTLEGGEGDDRIDGGAGIDTASYAGAAGGVTVSLATTEAQATGAGSDILVGVENLTGSSHDDTLTGNGGANLIDGGAGDDAMAGGAGDDTYVVSDAGDTVTEAAGGGTDTVRSSLASYTLGDEVENLVLVAGAVSGTGNAGANELTGNAHDNTLDGAGGDDTVVLDGAVTDYNFVYSGANTIVTSAAGGSDTLIGIENVKIGGVTYNLVRGTNAANNGASAVVGTAEADLVLGFNGLDELRGNGGDDILVGGAGNDSMAGGAGNDTYVVNNAGDFVTESLAGSGGVDTILSSVSRNLNTAAQASGDIENVTLIGTGNINATGNGLDNVLTGNAGDNTLAGQGGADTLIGMGGNDTLNGGAGNDILDGGAGSDTLNGGAGTDTARFAGAAADYAFGFTGTALTSVTHLPTGDTDTLANIERVQFGEGPVLAIVSGDGTITAGQAAILFGGDGNDTITGSTGNDIIIGGPGDDTLYGTDVGDGDDNTFAGSRDDDTFIWRVGDGSDVIHGGMEAENGDVFQIVGNADAETYRIYTYDEAVARIGFAGSDETEIVVTRQIVGGEETVIAELTEIEEIVVNGSNVAGNGASGGDTFEIYGNFDTTTNLRPNTITVIGSSGDDTVDITSLLSAHRIVFRTKGGNDTIIGTLRPQDVIELPDGQSLGDCEVVENADGSKTLTSGSHSVRFFTSGGMPQIGGSNGDDEADDDDDVAELPGDDDPPSTDDDDPPDQDEDDEGDDAAEIPIPAPLPATNGTDVLVGTAKADTLVALGGDDVILANGGHDAVLAGQGNDFVNGGAGRDVISADEGDDHVFAGAGADMVYGDAGNDRLFGEGGDDLLEGGAGDDTVVGGAGNDRFVATIGDGNDTYFGDELNGGNGVDTLIMSSVSAAVTVNLGTGVLGHGSASSAQTGTDTLWGIENVQTGSGADSITASEAVNVMDGGDGNDTFHFLTAAAAIGDTILNFQPGDVLDLSGIDANTGVAGNQAFTIVAGSIGAAAQLMVSYETREDGEYTVVSGNTGGDTAAEFKISLKGAPTLTADNFIL